MNKNRWQRAVALVVIATFLSTGCTSLQGVPFSRYEQPIQWPAVQVGESVVVTTANGEKRKFKVIAVEVDALVGKNVRIPYADIQAIDAQRTDGARIGITAIVVGAVVLIAALVALVDNADEYGYSGY